MTGISRGSWQYGILLIILFATATVAVRTTLINLNASMAEGHYGEAIKHTSFAVWALTMGFMFIAGAFGLWAIRFAGIAETRHRIARIIEAMDNIEDWLIAVDTQGKLISHNAPLQMLIDSEIVLDTDLQDLFTTLTADNLKKLLDRNEPYEMEIEYPGSQLHRTLRFRSQPAPGLTLIFISDVTTIHDQQIRNRQAARFQLIGQIARGVANDFNNILCGISGHASLLSHLNQQSPDMSSSLEAIQQDSDKGISLAGKLMSLGYSGSSNDRPTANTLEHVDIAANLLRSDLPVDWTITTETDTQLPPISLTGSQIEQVIYHIGLMMTDTFKDPGTVTIEVKRPSENVLLNVDPKFAVVILIIGKGSFTQSQLSEYDQRSEQDAGVIISVIETLLSSVEGTIDFLRTPEGNPVYRINIPYGNITSNNQDVDLPEELRAYMARWKTLIAVKGSSGELLTRRLDEIGTKYEWVDNVISVLSKVENIEDLDSIVVEKNLLGAEADGLLKAINKLCPGTGIVVLTDNLSDEDTEQIPSVLYRDSKSPIDKICSSMIEAKSLAIRNPQTIEA